MWRKKFAHLEQAIEQGKSVAQHNCDPFIAHLHGPGLREFPPSTRGFTASVVNYVNERMGGGLTPSQLTAWLQSARRRNHPGIPGSRRRQQRQSSLANLLASGSHQSTTEMPTSQEPSIDSVNLVSRRPASCLPQDALLARVQLLSPHGSVYCPPQGLYEVHSGLSSSTEENTTISIGSGPEVLWYAPSFIALRRQTLISRRWCPPISQQSRHSLALITSPCETNSMDMSFGAPSQSSEGLTLNPEGGPLGSSHDIHADMPWIGGPADDSIPNFGSAFSGAPQQASTTCRLPACCRPVAVRDLGPQIQVYDCSQLDPSFISSQLPSTPLEDIDNLASGTRYSGSGSWGRVGEWTISEPPVSSLQGNVVENARDAGTLPGDDLSSAFLAVNSSDYGVCYFSVAASFTDETQKK
ncbi:hypothetical protein B0H13DRAFT_1887141 [Mycena leptocephala]|nr:hypothetical protein B0H13DRAFT_1887141 [Mycena leptocephala]